MPSSDQSAAPVRVLLVNLNRYDQPSPVYPLGLAYVDSALRAAGHATRIWDARMSPAPLEAAVAAFAPDYVGLSLRNIDNVQCHNPRSFIHELLECCRNLRACTRAPLVLGGSGFSVFPRELYELTGVDYGIAGDGERAFVRLLAARAAGAAPDDIAGVVFRDSAGGVQHVPAAADAADFTVDPVHDPALLAAYVAQGALPGVQTQRGCPLNCCYCTYPLIEGKRSRFRSGGEIAAEMGRLAALGVRYAFIVDSVFNTRPDHVREICEALIRAKLDLHWECFLRPHGVTRELLALMQRAGLRHIEFGSDSFSDPVLARYGKSFTFDDIRQASEAAHALGLHYGHFIIFGGPGETPATLEETLSRTALLPGAFFFATIGMRIYPGTPLWRQLAPERKGETPADYLIEPRFFLEPPFTAASLQARIQAARSATQSWTVGDLPPQFVETMGKLRDRGLRGPFWEYAEVLQRLQPR